MLSSIVKLKRLLIMCGGARCCDDNAAALIRQLHGRGGVVFMLFLAYDLSAACAEALGIDCGLVAAAAGAHVIG